MKFDQLNNQAIREEIGDRVRRERLNQNITQEALANAAGLSRPRIFLFQEPMPSVVFPEILGLISASTFRRPARRSAGSV